jgi:hypothetical protein
VIALLGVNLQKQLGGSADFLRPHISSLVSFLMRFRDGFDKRTESNFVQISGKSATETVAVIRNAFTEEIVRRTRKFQTHRGRKKAKAVKSKLIIFFHNKGIFRKEFVVAGQTLSSTYCCDVSLRLLENVPRFRTEISRQKNWLFNHNNTTSHTSFFTREFLTKSNMTIVQDPQYSPDSAACNFYVSRHFDTI